MNDLTPFLVNYISVDILDDGVVEQSSIRLWINGFLAYNSSGFIVPFFGDIFPTAMDGYSGYHLSVSNLTPYPFLSTITIEVLAEDNDGYSLDGYWQFRIAAGLTSLSQGPYEITLDASFSGPMLLSSLLDASLYQISGGAYVRQVETLPLGSSIPTGVRLWLEGFQGDGFFTLMVSHLVKDLSGDALAPSGRTAQIYPFQSTAYFSNTSGYVRSRHVSTLAKKDNFRVYLIGTKGMDVFDISRGFEQPLRWAQILDGYGFGAACVLGTADYAFKDTDPPFLANRNPYPGQTGVSIGTDILLSVADEVTSVEVTAIAVYVNSHLAFSGMSGWNSGYGGCISVVPQIVSILLYPPVGGVVVGTNTVSVVAMDLAGNLLNTSYTFIVGTSPLSEGGFGHGSFGEVEFGE